VTAAAALGDSQEAYDAHAEQLAAFFPLTVPLQSC
jgi:hypothetical protein